MTNQTAGATRSSRRPDSFFPVSTGQLGSDGGRGGQTMLDPVSAEREEGEHRILAAIRESGAERAAVRQALDASRAPPLSEPPGQNTRPAAAGASQQLSEPV